MDADLELKQDEKRRKYKAETMLVWLLTFTVVMVFAGLTSAYIIRKESKDWMQFELPEIYFLSSAILILSSIFMMLTLKSVKKDKQGQAKLFMLVSLILGVVFCFTQYKGLWQMHENGIFAVGPGANISASFILVLSGTHVMHLIMGMFSMLWTFFKLNKGAYSSADFHGLKLCSNFWHFMDILWLYLFLFLFFIR